MQVKEIQAALKKEGFYTGEIDGDFGPLSREARNKALADFGVDTAGWPHSRRMVAIRQWALKREGFDPGKIDGLYGSKTCKAESSYLASDKTEPTRHLGHEGEKLIQSFESFRAEAYPDPGSSNGKPVTIGWGSTRDENGKPIKLGTRWTRAQADAQFRRDIESTVADVAKAIGDASTSQEQFDALVSFHYNTGAIGKATLTKKHIKGDFAGAADEFARWNKNDGKVMRGLVRRRAAEARLYRSGMIAEVAAFSGGTGRPPPPPPPGDGEG